jgi:hypothetical protein
MVLNATAAPDGQSVIAMHAATPMYTVFEKHGAGSPMPLPVHRYQSAGQPPVAGDER